MATKMRTYITYRGSAEAKIKGFPKALKEILRDAVSMWHRDYLKFHFGTPGSVESRYPGIYKKRTAKYMRRKAMKHGHQNALEYSGRTKIEVTSFISISGTSKNATGRMRGANRALNFGDGVSKPDMRKELLIVAPGEATELGEFVQSQVADFLNKNDDVKTVEV
jgi:hypothetical protein